ncbi:hypothetical protein J5N97_004562 [Dioscorea zingiberensis]|uniref:Uncharacterized protein n=1 Tax=Dioscorea zingiberensis TaxID=325984 RepID=A0A9D5HRX7_9LILI|nr:hypothetical protein J5N97_004562 [Dioscorea zingiberensis]
MGHLIPLAELAKKLTITHGFSVTLITFSNFSNKAQTSLLSSLPSTISSISLPLIPLHGLPSNYPIDLVFSTFFSRSLPSLHSILSSLTSTTHVTAYITDIFGAESLSTARSLAVPPFLFFTTTLLPLSFMLHLPDLNTSSPPDPLTLPGCIPILTEDLPDGWEGYKRMLRHAKHYNEADGILVNSFINIEPGAARFLLDEDKPGRPRVHPIGPLIQTSSIGDADIGNCMTWLDEQPRGSVLFVCFGSGGTLSVKQTNELALGLEMSGQGFLWAVRSPSDSDASGPYFDSESARDPFAFLPQRFVERNRGVGKVVALMKRPRSGSLTHRPWGVRYVALWVEPDVGECGEWQSLVISVARYAAGERMNLCDLWRRA